MSLDLDSLKSAVQSLQSALGVAARTSDASNPDAALRDVVRAGVIQNFEFTYELSWKLLQRWLEVNVGNVYVDGITRKELFRLSAEHRLIEDTQRWMDYHRARNLTAHTYRSETALEVFEVAARFVHDAERLVRTLEQRND
ncbi:MAG: nucleotidyltransferase substrate binding protein [Candidatus Wallbacteria bacterium]|nr:nucleotidyltransferase substrate binding protein [Candidatus Wallbacteria bacterium]